MQTLYVGRMSESGQWEILTTAASYDEADHLVELWSHAYPNAWVDILDGALSVVD